ncbi:unnamed protein product, partial [Discosporangium mesarthrocarpum]
GGVGGGGGTKSSSGSPPKAKISTHQHFDAFDKEGTSMKDRFNWARRTWSQGYRELKATFSSEMEEVVLKATRPDGMGVKPKHLEALLRPSHEMPKEFNVYPAVVR